MGSLTAAEGWRNAGPNRSLADLWGSCSYPNAYDGPTVRLTLRLNGAPVATAVLRAAQEFGAKRIGATTPRGDPLYISVCPYRSGPISALVAEKLESAIVRAKPQSLHDALEAAWQIAEGELRQEVERRRTDLEALERLTRSRGDRP